ncbi:MAG: hypothetical protein OXG53_17045 [Chloroflexi bacterium]|nr:hypothetical protein [Chloroflexota bacterium]
MTFCRGKPWLALWILCKALLLAFALATPVYAADITADETCSLADAISAANADEAVGGCPAGDGADVIRLSADVSLEDLLPPVNSVITLEGSGYTISGSGQFQILRIETGELTLNAATLSYGYNGWGGAISNEGTVQVFDSQFSGNFADAQGGAIYNEGELYISNSSFQYNYAGYGGAIQTSGVAHIESVTFINNVAEYGGGAIDSGVVDTSALHEPELAIMNSAFRGNSAGWGGAILAEHALSISGSDFVGNAAEEGGALYSWGQIAADITNTTFAHNEAEYEGGSIYDDGAARHGDVLTLAHVTFASNSALSGNNIFLDSDLPTDLNMYNSIIASEVGHNCIGVLALNADNLVSDASCGSAPNGNPMLADLIEPEDGSPAYFPLLPGSPAIDAASSDFCPQADQIGTSRPQGDGCDIGAIEYVLEH